MKNLTLTASEDGRNVVKKRMLQRDAIAQLLSDPCSTSGEPSDDRSALVNKIRHRPEIANCPLVDMDGLGPKIVKKLAEELNLGDNPMLRQLLRRYKNGTIWQADNFSTTIDSAVRRLLKQNGLESEELSLDMPIYYGSSPEATSRFTFHGNYIGGTNLLLELSRHWDGHMPTARQMLGAYQNQELANCLTSLEVARVGIWLLENDFITADKVDIGIMLGEFKGNGLRNEVQVYLDRETIMMQDLIDAIDIPDNPQISKEQIHTMYKSIQEALTQFLGREISIKLFM